MTRDDPLRAQLARFIDWREGHADFDSAVAGLPSERRGVRAERLPHSPWELLEHLRLTQRDILDFCRDPDYHELSWPADYWPTSTAPPSDDAWDASVAAYRADREAMRALATDESVDLFAKIPHGTGQTYLRELLLIQDHAAYHIGQLVLVRRALSVWPAG